ncbi:VOC family protein [Plantactinospora sp. ZYX-F-223]|uniref:VOC family protein n=1 Tax=Plantactinospora sp. ZYX-F-223 TaxID=3144103 RepID=UPI0031FC5BE4
MNDSGLGAPQTLLANVFTLGVRDLGRQRDFYRSLGFPQVVDDADFAAFQLHGAVLALFPAEKLAADGRGDQELGRGGIRFTIGIVVRQAAEVDRLADQFGAAGGRITKKPTNAEFFPGRSAYVADPEDNFFEIVWAEPDNAIVAAAYRAARLTPPARQ